MVKKKSPPSQISSTYLSITKGSCAEPRHALLNESISSTDGTHPLPRESFLYRGNPFSTEGILSLPRESFLYRENPSSTGGILSLPRESFLYRGNTSSTEGIHPQPIKTLPNRAKSPLSQPSSTRQTIIDPLNYPLSKTSIPSILLLK